VGTGSRFDILLDTKQVHEIIKFFSDSHHSLS